MRLVLELDALFLAVNKWASAHYSHVHSMTTRWRRSSPISVPLELKVFCIASISPSVFNPNLKSSNPKNYVYGISELTEGAERYGLRANYSLSLEDISINFVVALVRSDHLPFLQTLWCSDSDLNLPS